MKHVVTITTLLLIAAADASCKTKEVDLGPADGGTTGTTTSSACSSDADCTEANAAKCDTDTGKCVACDASAQCTGVEAGEVCSEGACVECTADESDACGTGEGDAEIVCNLLTNECGDETQVVGSADECEPCVNDNECEDGQRCVLTQFGGEDDGYHCLTAVAPNACVRPFGGIIIEAESLNGIAEAEYCGFDQANISCGAIRSLLDSVECPGDDAALCGKGARCETIGALENRCTYQCGNETQCPLSIGCDEYCGG